MRSLLDPPVRLALALNSSPGAYAVLLGSGISAAAGVPTGQQVIANLISKVPALEGASTERNELLRRHFEPVSHRPLQPALRAPTTAHRALGQLAGQGYVSVFLTTNFDWLLEHALAGAGVEPVVLM
jgi:NAD-dependent SIR2 family protein deacetylase